MFVRTKQQVNGKVSILIVENVRKSGKVIQHILRRVATVLPSKVERFIELAEHIKTEMEVERSPALFPVQTLAEMVISSRNRSIGDDSPHAHSSSFITLRTTRPKLQNYPLTFR